ncbi:sialidase family protein [Dyadobacter sp. 676]|uniref:Sialidase family protein n=1 Tax=Dyadobacter sp. 676 TaxID=3088362 RepID=A0AAU8FPU6_9BACT
MIYRFCRAAALICLVVQSFAQSPDFTQVPGTVIAHSPAASGLYIGSPSIAILPNGDYVASHDFFGPKSNEHVRAISRVYRSRDRGKSWQQISEINGQFWSKLFVYQGKLYMLGTDRHHGNMIIRNSADYGRNWTEPTDDSHGLLKAGEYHCAPMPLIEHRGRLWRAIEDAAGPPKQWGKRYSAFVASIPLGADPMIASNWLSTNVMRFDSTYLDGHFTGWLEGNAVVMPDGSVADVLRVDDRTTLEEKAAIVRISEDGKTASFDPDKDFISFPGGSKKFTIRFDPKTKLYWTLTNLIPGEVKKANAGKSPAGIRNTLALYSSKDLITWDFREILLRHPDVVRHGFQYVDWLFDGRDIVFVCRTAFDDGLGGARNNHDANFLTFHRIRKYAKR